MRQVFAGGLAFGLAVGLAFGLTHGFWTGITFGLAGGTAFGLSLAVRSAWGQWLVLTRVWLPLTGRLPWRTHAFLTDAHQRGVLRQTGAVYQFRHCQLQDHLGCTTTPAVHPHPTDEDRPEPRTTRGAPATAVVD